MNFEHKELAGGRWMDLPFFDQMANIGSEIERTIRWRNKGNANYSQRAFERALELLYLTIDDKKNVSRLRELTRVREALSDFYLFNNEYNSTDLCWQKYFYQFTYAARAGRVVSGNS